MASKDLKVDTKYVVTEGNKDIPKGTVIAKKTSGKITKADVLLLVFGKNGGFFLNEEVEQVLCGLKVRELAYELA